MDGVKPNFISGAREIIDGNIQQCLNCPQNVPVRLLLVQTLLAMKKVWPEILPEFKDKLSAIAKRKTTVGASERRGAAHHKRGVCGIMANYEHTTFCTI